ncbi:hypothetical protein [Streptomyces sp. NPDC056169]|uniref:hypothetical protein n=1 Tax=Streptomyces sp. NPDC056169 TaxID=3345734 RepID=UPI0035D899DB
MIANRLGGPRAERQNSGPHRNLGCQGAADRWAEPVRKMRVVGGQAHGRDQRAEGEPAGVAGGEGGRVQGAEAGGGNHRR